MNRSDFEQQLEAWIRDCRDSALHAFDTKCDPARCLAIGASMADARNALRQSERAGAIAIPAGLMGSAKRTQ